MASDPTARWVRSAASSARRHDTSRRSSSARSSRHIKKGDLGASPWQPQIEGGNHASYSEIGGPQLQPLLGESGKTRLVPAAPANPSMYSHQVTTSEICDLPCVARDSMRMPPERRRLTFCPQMRRRGICRLPSCPFVHEAFRSRKEHTPLYGVNAPKLCEKVPCRFLKVLGCCPYAENCVYSHSLPVEGAEDTVESGVNEDSSACTLADQGIDVAALFVDFFSEGSQPMAPPKSSESTPRRPRPFQKVSQSMNTLASGGRRRNAASTVPGRPPSRRRPSEVQSSVNS